MSDAFAVLKLHLNASARVGIEPIARTYYQANKP